MQERLIDSERAPWLFELQCIAEETFGSAEVASEWMRRAHPMLDGESPDDWATSAVRADRVKEILAALKFGGAV